MFSMKHFPYVLQFWISLLMATAMTVIFSFIKAGGIFFPGVLMDCAVATAIAYVAGLVVPLKKLADGFAHLCKAKDGTLAHNLLSTLIYAIYYSIVFSVYFVAKAIGFPSYFLKAVISDIPLGFAIGYVAALIVTPIAVRITKKMCKKSVNSK